MLYVADALLQTINYKPLSRFQVIIPTLFDRYNLLVVPRNMMSAEPGNNNALFCYKVHLTTVGNLLQCSSPLAYNRIISPQFCQERISMHYAIGIYVQMCKFR